MSLILVCRFIAVYGRLSAVLIVLLLYLPIITLAADCDEQATPQQKLERFKEVDREGEQAMQAKRFSDAVKLYREAACLAPRSPRALYGLGTAQAASQDFLDARESFHMADAIQPTSPLPLVMQARVNVSLGDSEALKANLRDLATRFPKDANLHSTLARFLAEKKLLVLALAEALRSEQASGTDAEAAVQLAALENAAGAYEDAARNATAIEAESGVSGNVRAAAAGIAGLSYENIRQQDEAIRHLSEAIRLNPLSENSYLALADLFEQAQNYAEAVKILKQGRNNLPNSTALLLPLGSDLVRTEQYKEGIDVLRELLHRAPDQDRAYLGIADAYRKTGNAEQEIEILRDLVGQKPDYPMIHVMMARAMLASSHVDYSKVLDELAQAEKSAPLDPDIFYLRAKVYVAMNRYNDAIEALQKSIQLRPMETGSYYQLARIYQKLGKSQLAAEQFERVKYLETASAK